MKHFWLAPWVLGLVLCGRDACGEEPVKNDWLTVEEHAWIAEHPVLRVAVTPDFYALEYVRDGQLRGLSVQYLDALSKMLGITFEYVEVPDKNVRIAMLEQGAVDLISMMWRIGPAVPAPGLLLTATYHNSPTIVISRVNSPLVFDLSRLEGKTVAIAAAGPYEPLLRAKARHLTIIRSASAEKVLNLVATGEADAALGTESYLIPAMSAQFAGRLELSGAIAPMASEISMAVRQNQVIWYSILQKSLPAITFDRALDIYNDWLTATDYGAPAVSSSIIEDYLHEVVLAGMVLMILLGLIHQTYLQRRRAMRSESEKAKFLAVMSHEIRSPMNAVLAAVELLALTRLNHEQRHLATLATRGASTLLHLLDDVLDVSRMEAHQLILEFEAVDVCVLGEDAVALYSLSSQKKAVDLSFDFEGPRAHLMLDRARITQILYNLISNAIKFTEQGSVHVIIKTGDTHERDVKQLDISVIDTGIGISEDSQKRLFRPYSQAHHSYKRSGGSGLGLVICRELVELMGGAISLTSEIGKGTVIAVSICAEVASSQNIDRPTSELPEPTKGAAQADCALVGEVQTVGLRILVVEDTRVNQEALLAQLRSFGLDAVLAPDAEHAVHEFQQHLFDLVLLDCDLPDRSGYVVAAEMRVLEDGLSRQRCPIVAISASTGNEHAARCFEAGMDGMLSKPIQLAKLKTTIELWCDVAVVQKKPWADHQPGFGPDQIRNEILEDLFGLLEAVALDSPEPALYRAHRLRGAALSLGWAGLALTAQKLEDMLRANMPQTDASYRAYVREIMRQWRQLDQELLACVYE